MAYTDHYNITDDIITHLNTVVPGITDPFLTSRYTGLVAISAVTVYELAIKEIFIDFAQKKHNVFGTFTEGHFNRINGRIKNKDIKDDYIKKFGEKYLRRYTRKLNEVETRILTVQRVSLKNSYANLLNWRNEFAHGGNMPTHATFNEVVSSYQLGKELIKCIAESMQR